MRRLALITLFSLFALAGSASGATVYVISGRGFGHGVGMSQYGAYGYALHGVRYGRILAHYYRGTTLGKVGSRSVRVLLKSAGSISFAGATAVNGKSLDPAKTYVAKPSGGGTDVRDSSGHEVQTFGPGALYVTGAGGAFQLAGTALNGVPDGRYSGSLEIAASGSNLDAIDVVALEDYVAGVVPGEMEASWPLEALKAQAVAARTYALTASASTLFDQFADTRSQEYKGLSGEQPRSTQAVSETTGQVVVYHGQLVTTYFFSTSGGRTESLQNVFYGAAPEPYLVSVKDPYDTVSPFHRWRLRLTGRQIQSRLGSLCNGTFRKIKVLRRGRSPRVVRADVVCSGATTTATGVRLQHALGLNDTWFYVTRISTKGVHHAVAANFLARLFTPSLELAGSFDPAPPGDRLTVERDVHGRFVTVGSAVTAANGDFTYAVPAAGVYRVRHGDTVGTPTRVG